MWVAGGVPLLLYMSSGGAGAFLCFVGGCIACAGCKLVIDGRPT